MSESAKYVFLYDLKRERILFQILNSKFGGAKFFVFLGGGSLLFASIWGLQDNEQESFWKNQWKIHRKLAEMRTVLSTILNRANVGT